jgi:ABC-type transport system involved in multi-copper enzyme maturation permease subunit
MGKTTNRHPGRSGVRQAAWFLTAAAAVGLLGWGSRWPLAQQVLAWVGVLLAAAILLRGRWTKLFGPVFFYDLLRTGRRVRYFLVRGAYASVLYLLLCWVYYAWVVDTPGGDLPASRLARFAETFFYTFMGAQFLTVAALTPAYVAGAVSEEKERGTLEFLLATDLDSREIVLGKLAARVINLTFLLLTGLPLLAALQFLGGVAPNLVLAGFAATGLTLASLAGLSILHSVLARKPRDALALTYLTAAAYLVVSGLGSLLAWFPAVGGFPSGSRVTVSTIVDWLNSGNLIALLYELVQGVRGGRHLEDMLPELLRNYAVFHGLVGGLAAWWAVRRLRAVSQKEPVAKQRRRLVRRPRVGRWPMVWKEVFAEPAFRPNAVGRVVLGVLVLATYVPAGVIAGFFVDHWLRGAPFQGSWFLPSRPWDWLAEMLSIWSRVSGALVACLLLLGVAVRASGGVSGERDRETLDALLTSPLSEDSILIAKWLGSLSSVRWGWLWLGSIWLLTLAVGGLHVVSLLLLLVAWYVYAGFVSTLGLWFSMNCRSTARATAWTLFTAGGLAFGHWLIWTCCLPLFAFDVWKAPHGAREALGWLGSVQVGLTPPLALSWYLPFRLEDFMWRWGHKSGHEVYCGAAGIVFWAVAWAVLWAATRRRFLAISGRRPFPWSPGRRAAPAEVLPLPPAAPGR